MQHQIWAAWWHLRGGDTLSPRVRGLPWEERGEGTLGRDSTPGGSKPNSKSRWVLRSVWTAGPDDKSPLGDAWRQSLKEAIRSCSPLCLCASSWLTLLSGTHSPRLSLGGWNNNLSCEKPWRLRDQDGRPVAGAQIEQEQGLSRLGGAGSGHTACGCVGKQVGVSRGAGELVKGLKQEWWNSICLISQFLRNFFKHILFILK